MFRKVYTIAIAAGLVLALGLGTALAAPAERATRPVVQLWDGEIVGISTLVRSDSGIRATVHTSGLPSGHVMTLWFVVFNNPSACPGAACGLADLLFNLDAEGDFLVGGGRIVGGPGSLDLGGALRVGDRRGSAFPEIGLPDRPIGLTDPWGAQVSVLLHSHGPAATGQTLVSQLSSFAGGCDVFLGDLELPGSGIADDVGDMPDAMGECSTVHGALFQ